MNKNIILLDGQVLTLQRYGGISRYFFEIYSRLRDNSEYKIRLEGLLCTNYYFRGEHNIYVRSSNKKVITLCRLINFVMTYIYLITHSITIIHPTYYDQHTIRRLHNHTKVVVTVHDMIHELYYGDDSSYKTRRIVDNKKHYIERADRIIAVSECTKGDILRVYPKIDKDKITVIYHGASVSTTMKPVIGLPDNFILFVGQRDGYKNFEVLLKAMDRLIKQSPIHLVCVGGPEFKESEKNLLLKNRLHHYLCDDEELNYLYNNAVCFVYPSFYEGFGIPILEAFANDCPVILSNCSCFPEIAGDAAIYFEASDHNMLADKILSIYQDMKLRDTYIALGKKRLKKYSWEKAALETMNVYETLLKEAK